MALLLNSGCSTGQDEMKKPNILIILADDLGYSDLGCFGSEIPTPNLDQLAHDGIRMTQFYNCAKCCPTRASLLTGLYPHQVGMGDMVEGRLKADSTFLPAYQGYLSEHCVTMPEVLRQHGYHTMMVGKWHVGDRKEHWPHSRGFDDVYTLIQGMSNYFNLKPWRREDQQILLLDAMDTVKVGDNFYMTSDFTQKAIRFLDNSPKDKPFFMYLAYTAPHFPLQALPEDIQLFRGKYMGGWDSIRSARFASMMEQEIIPATSLLSPAYKKGNITPAWDDLSEIEKLDFDLRMATHAAMIYRMDIGIGKIIQLLKQKGIMDNTLIMFLSDNGASEAAFYLVTGLVADRTGEIGTEKSFESQGPGWGNASNTPLSLFKKYTGEGGIRTGFIAHWPGKLKRGEIIREPAHVIDLMPTLIEISGTNYPKKYNGKTIIPYEGQSLMPLWNNETADYQRSFGFEHMGNKAFRQGSWKIVFTNKHSLNPEERWELYDIDNDPGEVKNLAHQYPERLTHMIHLYDRWAGRVGVFEPYDSLILAHPF